MIQLWFSWPVCFGANLPHVVCLQVRCDTWGSHFHRPANGGGHLDISEQGYVYTRTCTHTHTYTHTYTHMHAHIHIHTYTHTHTHTHTTTQSCYTAFITCLRHENSQLNHNFSQPCTETNANTIPGSSCCSVRMLPSVVTFVSHHTTHTHAHHQASSTLCI